MSAKAVKALGLDLGSTTMKMVAVDAAGKMVWHLLEPAQPRVEEQVAHFIESAERDTGFSNHLPLVATGYGRNLAKQADKTVTEITCHARGVFREYDHGGTLIDIGGQDSKVISISPQGKVIDFAMNDKCAAGTGRFLENTAARLGVPLEEMGSSALSTDEEVSISSTCTVFAESEIVSLIARGIAVPPILRGLHRSLIKRIGAMVMAVGIAPPLMLSGGVVLNPAIQHMLADELSEEVLLPRHPQLMGAYGAALIALGM
ncbi:MAG: acyl-CoA dehydratase activase [Anaerolineae bacterium]|nr:acyl-CoA dehydratase activase [Anaerolineae bacterium]